MHAIVLAITAAVTVGLASPVLAAPSSVRAKVLEMRAKNPHDFAACQQLATQRGFNAHDNEYGRSSFMMFIDGCIMGRQR